MFWGKPMKTNLKKKETGKLGKLRETRKTSGKTMNTEGKCSGKENFLAMFPPFVYCLRLIDCVLHKTGKFPVNLFEALFRLP